VPDAVLKVSHIVNYDCDKNSLEFSKRPVYMENRIPYAPTIILYKIDTRLGYTEQVDVKRF
jgi:hypothetical protein